MQQAELEIARQGTLSAEVTHMMRYQQPGMAAGTGYAAQEDPLAMAARTVAGWGERLGSVAKLKIQEMTAKCMPQRQRAQLEAEDARMDLEHDEDDEALAHHAQPTQSNVSESQLMQRRKPTNRMHQPDSDEAAIRRATMHGDDGL